MNKRLGTYVIKKVPGESYKAYVPAKLPPEPTINLENLKTRIERAERNREESRYQSERDKWAKIRDQLNRQYFSSTGEWHFTYKGFGK